MPTIPTRTKPTKDDLVEPDEVYRWNSHTDAYAKNEEARKDDVGKVSFVLDDVPEDEAMMSSLWVSPSEGVHIDVQMSNDPEAEETITFEVYTFAEALSSKAEEGNFMKSIGSTYAPNSTLLIVTSNDNCSDNQLEEPEKSEEDQWDDMEDVIAKMLLLPEWLP
jgi:hypothetical protein